MGLKKKRTCGVGVVRTFEGNWAIALTALEISRGVDVRCGDNQGGE